VHRPESLQKEILGESDPVSQTQLLRLYETVYAESFADSIALAYCTLYGEWPPPTRYSCRAAVRRWGIKEAPDFDDRYVDVHCVEER